MNRLVSNLSVKNKLLVITLMFSAVLMGVVIYTIATLQQQRADSTVVNIAGRQRMLTQKFTKELFEDLALGKATTNSISGSETVKLFELSLQAMRNGGKTFADLAMTKTIVLPQNREPDIVEKLQDVEQLWAELQKAALQVVAQKPGSNEFLENLAAIRRLNLEALETMDRAVEIYAETSAQKIDSMINVEWSMLLVMLPLGIWFSFVIGRAITRPLDLMVNITGRVAKGDISVGDELGEIGSNDEMAALADSFQTMISVLSRLQMEITQLAKDASDGLLDKTSNSQEFEGVWADLLVGIDSIIKAFVVPFRDTADYLDRISRGDIPPLVKREYRGGFNDVKESFNRSITIINGLLDESQSLIDAAHSGDLECRGDIYKFEGSWRELIDGLNGVFEAVVDPVQSAGEVLRTLSEGELRQLMEGHYRGAYATLQDNVNTTISRLEDIVIPVQEAADLISKSAIDIYAGNNSLSLRTDKQSSSLQETATSIEQLTGTVRNNAENAKQANKLAVDARCSAEHGGEVVSRAVQAMEEISNSSNQIAEIIGVIDEIAFQTNLLALNASVEAARAGEQGRGFAVVATEVRNLAGRSATAAKEIKELIQDSLKKVQAGTSLVNESGKTLDEITDGVNKVSDIISEIDAASAEQTTGIDQVNQAIISMDEIVQQNTVLAEKTSIASGAMRDKAQELEQLMQFFKVNRELESQVESDYVTTEPDELSHSLSDEDFTEVSELKKYALDSVAIDQQNVDESDEWEEF